MIASIHELFKAFSGGQFEPVYTGQFKPVSGGQFKSVWGGQFHRFLHKIYKCRKFYMGKKLWYRANSLSLCKYIKKSIYRW
jgi:hypothetical protein